MQKLADDVFRRLAPKIDSLAEDPRPPNCVKLAGQKRLYRVRVSDWRIVYEVDDERRLVTVTVVAHRRESYRGM